MKEIEEKINTEAQRIIEALPAKNETKPEDIKAALAAAREIKEKADDIIGKMPAENDNNTPNTKPELDELIRIEIEKLINNAIYSNREIVEIEREIYNRIIDSNLLNSDEKIKLQSLRVSKKIYFEFVDDYGKVDRYLQGLIDLREE
ncbi:3176_t:CDS:2, partial [Scutellospora calospora]